MLTNTRHLPDPLTDPVVNTCPVVGRVDGSFGTAEPSKSWIVASVVPDESTSAAYVPGVTTSGGLSWPSPPFGGPPSPSWLSPPGSRPAELRSCADTSVTDARS